MKRGEDAIKAYKDGKKLMKKYKQGKLKPEDIMLSRCTNSKCKMRAKCYRWKMKKMPGQDAINYRPIDGVCDFYIPLPIEIVRQMEKFGMRKILGDGHKEAEEIK